MNTLVWRKTVKMFMIILGVCFLVNIVIRRPKSKLRIGEQDDESMKILVLAQPRTGSSFTGDLLSALDSSYYVFEPLSIFKKAFNDSNAMRQVVLGSFTCDEPVLRRLARFRRPLLRKNGDSCLKSSPRVVKTIRISHKELEPWIYRTSIKVVHLVRDPRAQINSFLKSSIYWGKELHSNFSRICRWIEGDIKLEEKLGSRYVRIRYEDLVDSPEEETKKLYEKLELPYTAEVEEFVRNHTSSKPKKGEDAYFSTYRDKSFKHDSWKTSSKMTKEIIDTIQTLCSDVMEKLKYEKVVLE